MKYCSFDPWWEPSVKYDMQEVYSQHCYKNVICMAAMFLSPSVNSLPRGRHWCKLKLAIFQLIWRIDTLSIVYEITFMWMSSNFTDNLSTMVQVMAWCHEALSHYLNQCWTRYMRPYGATRSRSNEYGVIWLLWEWNFKSWIFHRPREELVHKSNKSL